MSYGIVESVSALCSYLEEKFEADKYTLQYKKSETPTPSEHEISGKPYIFPLTVPSSLMQGVYPKRCPCVVVVVDGHDDDNLFSCSAHICCCDSTQSGSEVVRPTEPESKLYKYDDSEDYNPSTNDYVLLAQTIRLVETVYAYLKQCVNLDLHITDVDLPAPSLDDYPYATGRIGFTLKINHSHVAQSGLHDFF